MHLYHVSEEPDITVFHPRLPKRRDLDPTVGLVWALTRSICRTFSHRETVRA